MTLERAAYRMLIVDDDPRFRETVRTIFADRFETLEAGSGEEAVAIVERQAIDLALLDMHMRVLDGLQTLRELRRFNATAPCILITADLDDALRRRASGESVFSVLKKPVTKRQLVATVSSALVAAYDDPGPFASTAS
jgi:CheY-like chemotaxis protein